MSIPEARRHRLRLTWRLLALGGAATLAAVWALSGQPAGAAPRPAARASNGVALPAHPTRIVSLSDAATEDLYAVGAGHQVIAVDQYSTYPPNAPRTKLDGLTPNVEAIATYHPDLVVISDNVDRVAQHLAALGIPVLLEAAPNALAGAWGQMLALGRATGHAAQAQRLVTTLQRRVAKIVASVPHEHPALTVYHELDQTYYSVTSATFIGRVYSLFGLRNIADAAHHSGVYPQLSSEYIIAANPDLIVLADTACCGQSYATVAKRPGWSHIAAVANHDVLGVNDTVASEWGPRIVLFIQDLANEIKRIEAQR